MKSTDKTLMQRGPAQPAIDEHRVQAEFHARGEAAWQEYLRTGVSYTVDEVCDCIQQRIDAKRHALRAKASSSTA